MVFGLFPPVLALFLLVHTIVRVPRLSENKNMTDLGNILIYTAKIAPVRDYLHFLLPHLDSPQIMEWMGGEKFGTF